MKNLKRITTLIILCMALLQFTARAQDEPENSETPPPEDTPIDGGLALLLAAGTIYGIKKCRDVNGEDQVKISLQ